MDWFNQQQQPSIYEPYTQLQITLFQKFNEQFNDEVGGR